MRKGWILVLLLIAAVIAVIAVARWAHEPTPGDAAPPASHGRARILELRHQPPASIAGVVTAAGTPFAATVCIRASRSESSPVRCTPTDVHGAYTLDLL